ncbi:MAG: TldD/PmbA family protein [Nitrospirae bacterium]|nr:TldD/PmbA family protein [Nitrospirota bacterium]
MDKSFAAKVLELAIAKGADEAEVYIRESKNLGIEIKDLKIETLESSVTAGYGIRVIKDKQPGFSYSTDPGNISHVVDTALEVARYAERDENLGFPLPLPSGDVSVFDRRIDSIDEQDAIELVMLVEKSALDADRRIRKIRKAAGSFGTSDTRIVNSKGVDACYSASGCSAHITVIAEEGSESQMGWDYEGSRFLDDVKFGRVGANAAKRALQLLGAKKIAPLKGSILLDSSVASEFLGIFASALSSESVQKGKSMLAGKKEEQVLSPLLNIIDNGLLDGKLGSKPFDGEGVPTRSKTLIEGGVLKGFLYNTYTARKEGVGSTGNASRGGASGLPGVGPTNLYVEPSSPENAKNFGKLLETVVKGIYVTETMGMHTANPVSGEFSVGISGLWIENGAVRYPVKEAVISGNVLDLFRQVIMVGDDLRFYGNIGVASLLIEAIDISG